MTASSHSSTYSAAPNAATLTPTSTPLTVSVITVLSSDHAALWPGWLRSVIEQRFWLTYLDSGHRPRLEILAAVTDEFSREAWRHLVAAELERVAVKYPSLPERVTAHIVAVDTDASIAATRNACLSTATGTVLVNLDDDDRWAQDSLGRVLAPMLGDTAVQAVAGRSADVMARVKAGVHDGGLVVQRPVWTQAMVGTYPIEGPGGAAVEAVLTGDYRINLHPSAVAWRIEAVRAAGGWDETVPVADDVALMLAVLAGYGGVLVVTDTRWHQHRRHVGRVGTDPGDDGAEALIIGQLIARALDE